MPNNNDQNDKSKEQSLAQISIIKEYFKMYPNLEIHTKDVVDWVTSTYLERTGKIFRDPDRGIRSLYQNELAKKENNQELQDFCVSILNVFEDFNINGHIEWKR